MCRSCESSLLRDVSYLLAQRKVVLLDTLLDTAKISGVAAQPRVHTSAAESQPPAPTGFVAVGPVLHDAGSGPRAFAVGSVTARSSLTNRGSLTVAITEFGTCVAQKLG